MKKPVTRTLGYDFNCILRYSGVRWGGDRRKTCAIPGGGYAYNDDGLVPGLLENFKNMSRGHPVEFMEAYAKVAPDPKQWPTLVTKVMRLGLVFKGWRPEDIQSIKAPSWS